MPSYTLKCVGEESKGKAMRTIVAESVEHAIKDVERLYKWPVGSAILIGREFTPSTDTRISNDKSFVAKVISDLIQ